jgi:hypothetical protein
MILYFVLGMILGTWLIIGYERHYGVLKER